MKNDTGNRIFNGNAAKRCHIVVLACFGFNAALAPVAVYADVPPPPPAYHKQIDTSFPSGQALVQNGYNPKTGVLKVEPQKKGQATVTSNGKTVTGTQNVDVKVTDKYGNKATVPSKVTQTVDSGAVVKGVAASFVVNGLGSAMSEFGNLLGNQIRQGDWNGALETSLNMGTHALDNITGGALTGAKGFTDGLGLTKPGSSNYEKGLNRLNEVAQNAAKAQSQAEQKGDVGGAIANAAVAKAANAAANAAAAASGATTSGAKLAEASKNKDGSYSQLYLRRIDIRSTSNINPKPKIEGYKYQIDKYDGIYNWQDVSSAGWFQAKTLPDGYSSVAGYVYEPITSDAELNAALQKVAGQSQTEQQKTVEDMTLSTKNIEQILQRMFESQQTNHAEMMRQLNRITANTAPQESTQTGAPEKNQSGGAESIVQRATTSRSVAKGTAVSAPFTPANSDTPMQTEFTLNPDGTVSTKTIPRPDLKPHSSQAPTRQEIPSTAQTSPATGQQGQQSGQTSQSGQQGQQSSQDGQQRDFCQQNPNAAQCADLGNADYEDLDIPENAIDLKLEPMDVFSTDGVCPANPTFSLGALGDFEIPYEYFCNIARLLRPILILGTIIMCGFFAYNAVKEL